MASGTTLPGSRGEHRDLLYWMERTLKELENVRAAPDPDAVHDLRVAIRRCRSLAAVMEKVDADAAWPQMRKLGRKLFRQLGELRDTQVLEDWVKRLGEETDDVRQRLQSVLAIRKNELRVAALKAAAKFDQKTWRKLERGLQRRSRLVPADGPAAECLTLERLDAARELHARALRTERRRPWHELRIGVKRFRYTVESLLPARYEAWGDDLKRIQDLLGDVHDLDVLSVTIGDVGGAEPEEVRAGWRERIAVERHQRIETYRQLMLGKTSLWRMWRQGLPHGEHLEAAALARLRVTAKALGGLAQRPAQVARLAVRVYEGLGRVHASPVFQGAEKRKLMRTATQLHGIGAALDSKSPEKAARNFLRKMAVPPGWTESEWAILANVVRYHRGALPNPERKGFAKLTQDEQKTVCAMAGVLRLARALRKCGVQSAVGLRMEKSADTLMIHVPGLRDSEQTAVRLAAGKYLLESFLDRPLIVKSAPQVSKVVELPRPAENPPQSEAALA
jgi:CHAD domain-containing protein